MANSRERAEIHRRRQPVFQALCCMPPLDHWPDKPQPFTWERSAVIQWIMEQGVDLREARAIFDHAHVHGNSAKAFITFDPERKVWRGVLHRFMTAPAESSRLRDASNSPAARRENRRTAELHSIAMDPDPSKNPFALLAAAAAEGRDIVGAGLRHYGPEEMERTRLALDEFNARCRRGEFTLTEKEAAEYV